MGYEPPQSTRRLSIRQELDVAAADKFADGIKEFTKSLHAEMKLAQDRYVERADRYRSSAPVFKKSDNVWLDTRNLKIARPSKKLSERYIRLYFITEVVSPTSYRIDLPKLMGNYNVCHTNLLRVVVKDPLPGQK